MTLSGDAGGIERGGVDTNTKGEDDQPQVSTDQRQGRRGYCRIRHAVLASVAALVPATIASLQALYSVTFRPCHDKY